MFSTNLKTKFNISVLFTLPSAYTLNLDQSEFFSFGKEYNQRLRSLSFQSVYTIPINVGHYDIEINSLRHISEVVITFDLK